jgi:hypothetical protein
MLARLSASQARELLRMLRQKGSQQHVAHHGGHVQPLVVFGQQVYGGVLELALGQAPQCLGQVQ